MRGAPGRDRRASGFWKPWISKRPERIRCSVSAKPGPNGKQERDPTKGLTFEESGRCGGNEKKGRRGTGGLLEGARRSVSNRNGGSQMMLDIKTEEE